MMAVGDVPQCPACGQYVYVGPHYCPQAQTTAVMQADTRTCTCHPDDNPPRPCPRKYALTECRVASLVDALWQLLDDMDTKGQGVCLAAKAQARIAIEPFLDADSPLDFTLEEARRIWQEANYG